MGEKNNYAIPLIIIISLLVIFVLFSFIVISTREDWVPFVASMVPSNRTSQTPYPTYTYYSTYEALATYTFLPTYTLAISPQPKWIWSSLPFHHISVEIPQNWTILPTNHRWDPNPYGPVGSGSRECEDYLIIGPDGKQIIRVTFVCWEGEGTGGPCPETIQMAGDLGESNYLYRLPVIEDNSYIYGTAYYGEWTWVTPRGSGYWCMGEYPTPLTYEVVGKKYYEITDFSIVDRIMKSLIGQLPK